MNSPISVKPIDDGLDLEQPFDEREVRDSECLVYETAASSAAVSRSGRRTPSFNPRRCAAAPVGHGGKDSPARLTPSPFGRRCAPPSSVRYPAAPDLPTSRFALRPGLWDISNGSFRTGLQ